MRILVVGGEGYLGKGFIQSLEIRHTAIPWDIHQDIMSLNHTNIKNLEIDLIVNFSVIANFTDIGIDTKSEYFRVNVKGIEHLVNIARDLCIPLVQLSTREVIGMHDWKLEHDLPNFKGIKLVNEDEPCKPLHPYGKTKLISEFITLNYEKASVIRLNTCYTSDFTIPKGLVSILVSKSRNEGKVVLDNSGSALRDPLHIYDLTSLILKIVDKQVFGEVFHAGGGFDNFLSLKEICKTANSKVDIIEGKKTVDKGFLMSIQKAVNLLDWTPQINLKSILNSNY